MRQKPIWPDDAELVVVLVNDVLGLQVMGNVDLFAQAPVFAAQEAQCLIRALNGLCGVLCVGTGQVAQVNFCATNGGLTVCDDGKRQGQPSDHDESEG